MATIECPNCGQEVYDKLDTCPHCGGPLEPKIDDTSDYNFSDILNLANELEKKWFIGSTIAAAVISIFLTIASGLSLESIATTILFYILLVYLFASFIYGMYTFHPLKRFMPFGLIIGLLLIWIVGCTVGMYGGFFFFYPRAIIRLIRHKPLLSEKEVKKMHMKNLL